jgi:RNA polymerase sigma factor (sigma-70 family)
MMQNESVLESKLDESQEEQQQEELFKQKLTQTMNAFQVLGEPCKSLLKTFYFEKKSLRDIAETLQIEETTARNKKYRCMEKLRDMVIASKT